MSVFVFVFLCLCGCVCSFVCVCVCFVLFFFCFLPFVMFVSLLACFLVCFCLFVCLFENVAQKLLETLQQGHLGMPSFRHTCLMSVSCPPERYTSQNEKKLAFPHNPVNK